MEKDKTSICKQTVELEMEKERNLSPKRKRFILIA
jgi:hypothetical protein